MAKVTVSTWSRSDLLGKLQAETGAQPYATSRQACFSKGSTANLDLTLLWWCKLLIVPHRDKMSSYSGDVWVGYATTVRTVKGTKGRNDVIVKMTTIAVSRWLPAPTDRKGLLHKMQAGKDDNGNPMSHEEFAASPRSGIRYDCERRATNEVRCSEPDQAYTKFIEHLHLLDIQGLLPYGVVHRVDDMFGRSNTGFPRVLKTSPIQDFIVRNINAKLLYKICWTLSRLMYATWVWLRYIALAAHAYMHY
ncbi:hypothetical protein EV421DRAFT_1743350 [Armillaria borealis]|uniref:Uncharacterized protein n=1 Tax=Armillaria borealis TaxID=47425 RepID=A0AA39IX33_9AGAR|nr:hypothetical protein EV421DRAFT_1743350 [Armillaria borealis]